MRSVTGRQRGWGRVGDPHPAIGHGHTVTLQDVTAVGKDDLSLDDRRGRRVHDWRRGVHHGGSRVDQDRKSTRLNSSHTVISYAVFCLKKKKKKYRHIKR